MKPWPRKWLNTVYRLMGAKDSEYTNKQLRDWLDRKVAEAKNPDPIRVAKEKLKAKREQNLKKIANNYGL